MAQSKRTPALPTAVNPGFSEIDARLSAGRGGMDVLPPAVGVVELAKAPRHFPTCRAGALSARRREAKIAPCQVKCQTVLSRDRSEAASDRPAKTPSCCSRSLITWPTARAECSAGITETRENSHRHYWLIGIRAPATTSSAARPYRMARTANREH